MNSLDIEEDLKWSFENQSDSISVHSV